MEQETTETSQTQEQKVIELLDRTLTDRERLIVEATSQIETLPEFENGDAWVKHVLGEVGQDFLSALISSNLQVLVNDMRDGRELPNAMATVTVRSVHLGRVIQSLL